MESLNILSATYNRVHKGVDVDGNDLGYTQKALTVVLENNEMLQVPLDPANRHYAEIMRQVEAGELVIEEAE